MRRAEKWRRERRDERNRGKNRQQEGFGVEGGGSMVETFVLAKFRNNLNVYFVF